MHEKYSRNEYSYNKFHVPSTRKLSHKKCSKIHVLVSKYGLSNKNDKKGRVIEKVDMQPTRIVVVWWKLAVMLRFRRRNNYQIMYVFHRGRYAVYKDCCSSYHSMFYLCLLRSHDYLAEYLEWTFQTGNKDFV